MEEFKKYVAINGGPIENTVVNFDGDGTKRIRTRDIILYGEEAQYIDLKVNDVQAWVNDLSNQQGLSAQTVKNIFLNLQSALKVAKKQKMIW